MAHRYRWAEPLPNHRFEDWGGGVSILISVWIVQRSFMITHSEWPQPYSLSRECVRDCLFCRSKCQKCPRRVRLALIINPHYQNGKAEKSPAPGIQFLDYPRHINIKSSAWESGFAWKPFFFVLNVGSSVTGILHRQNWENGVGGARVRTYVHVRRGPERLIKLPRMMTCKGYVLSVQSWVCEWLMCRTIWRLRSGDWLNPEGMCLS